MGDTWRVVETITKTGETDQGMTVEGYGVMTSVVLIQFFQVSFYRSRRDH